MKNGIPLSHSVELSFNLTFVPTFTDTLWAQETQFRSKVAMVTFVVAPVNIGNPWPRARARV
jgi:hypothetical protein